jgi:hypothetical protein
MSLTKKNFVLRIDEESFSSLAKWAEDEFRSVNGQIEMIIDKALKEAGRKKNAGNTVKHNGNHNKVTKHKN